MALLLMLLVADGGMAQSLQSSPIIRRRQHLNSLRMVTSGSKIVVDVRRRLNGGGAHSVSENETQPNLN